MKHSKYYYDYKRNMDISNKTALETAKIETCLNTTLAQYMAMKLVRWSKIGICPTI